MQLITKVKDIDAALVRIHETGQSLQQDMHLVACSVLQHFAKHSDKRVVLKLLHAMPEMARVNALRDWMNEFGTMTIGENDEIMLDKSKKLRLGAAMEKPFWKFKVEADYKPLVMAKWVETQVKALRKDAEKTKRDHSAAINALLGLSIPAELANPAATPDPFGLGA